MTISEDIEVGTNSSDNADWWQGCGLGASASVLKEEKNSMAQKRTNIIGLPIQDLYAIFEEKSELSAREARLIPMQKPGDEIALTSVFLSSLRLVKEFRNMVSENIDLSVSGKIHVFTEVEFLEFDGVRPDGMICVERGKKIIDAALLEMKNGNALLKKEQVEKYTKIAEAYSIPKLITISNQFVSNPRQSPIALPSHKKISTFHLSWTFVLTLAYILLADNDTNIEDPDQVEMMREILKYLEHDKSGIKGFTAMKEGWKVLAERVNKGENIKKTDSSVTESVEGWLQEERDMALVLSRKLGTLVETGVKKHINDLTGRIADETKKLAENHSIESSLRVSGAASPIKINADFDRRTIEMRTSVPAPQDKSTIRGQIGWIKAQLGKMQKHQEAFNKIDSELSIFFSLKNYKGEERISLSQMDDFSEKNKGKYIKHYGFVLVRNLGQKFGGPKKIVKELEDVLISYYQGVVQHLDKWEKPAPEIKDQIPSRPALT